MAKNKAFECRTGISADVGSVATTIAHMANLEGDKGDDAGL